MAVIDSPGRPLSVPHESWRYCDTVRVRSSADAETLKQTPTSLAIDNLSSRSIPKPSAVQVLEFLNHHLSWLLQRIFFARNGVKDQTDYCLTRCRYGRRELMFRNQLRCATRRFSAKGLEACTSRFPAQDKRQGARGRRESKQVTGYV